MKTFPTKNLPNQGILEPDWFLKKKNEKIRKKELVIVKEIKRTKISIH
jgi:hypothetical protein